MHVESKLQHNVLLHLIKEVFIFYYIHFCFAYLPLKHNKYIYMNAIIVIYFNNSNTVLQ